MDAWERTLREDAHPHRRKTPSFSSSLLDAIYRSIDDSNGNDGSVFSVEATTTATTVRRKQSRIIAPEEEHTSLRRAIMIEKWMESHGHGARTLRAFNLSSTSSTDSSIFSSSETESTLGPNKPRKSLPRPNKQGRTAFLARSDVSSVAAQSPKLEGKFTTTKSRALKIYGDLKKVKQPISPGGKITSFLNSLFNSRTAKKMRADDEDWGSVRKSRSVKDSTMCSTASSFSRSCLSKTPSSRGKSKRSVRFCPVSVIVDEDCRPCGHKSLYNDPTLMPVPSGDRLAGASFLKDVYRFGDGGGARGDDFLKRSMNLLEIGADFHGNEEDEDDDAESCCSSDLFELENIGSVGIGAYREELPVYGTTDLTTNQAIAIANGFVL